MCTSWSRLRPLVRALSPRPFVRALSPRPFVRALSLRPFVRALSLRPFVHPDCTPQSIFAPRAIAHDGAGRPRGARAAP
jgi:hypothetical protein